MVDHRADGHRSLAYIGERPGWRSGLLDRVIGSIDGVVGWLTGRGGGQAGDDDGWTRSLRLPLAITAVWLIALGAYGAGYLARTGTETGVTRALPTLDLLFFAFAVAGPLAMLWMVVLLHARSARLSEALATQSESALALAATVATLNEAVDRVTAGATDRLDDTTARVERDAQAALVRIDRVTRDLAAKLDAALLDSIVMLDRKLLERTARSEAALAAQREALERSLRDRVAATDAALEAQREAISARLDADAARLARALEAAAQALIEAQDALAERIAAGLTERRAQFDRGIADLLSGLKGRLDAIGSHVDEALMGLANELAAAENARQKALEEGLGEREKRLQAGVDEMVQTVAVDVAPLLVDLRTALTETRRTVAANPPASAERLSALLGEAAERRIGPERAALTDAVGRIAALEEESRRLLAQIDRTARLNPLMTERGAAAPAPTREEAAGLPFAILPQTLGRGALNWTAAIRALDGLPAGEAGRRAVKRAAGDPDIAALAALSAKIDAALAEDGLHLGDLIPVHAPAELWLRFAGGERGGEIDALAGIEDEVALAIARTRLRDDTGFRAAALRLVATYARLVARAAAELGADPRLVELAETPAGRAFMLLAGPTRALRPMPVTPD